MSSRRDEGKETSESIHGLIGEIALGWILIDSPDSSNLKKLTEKVEKLTKLTEIQASPGLRKTVQSLLTILERLRVQDSPQSEDLWGTFCSLLDKLEMEVHNTMPLWKNGGGKNGNKDTTESHVNKENTPTVNSEDAPSSEARSSQAASDSHMEKAASRDGDLQLFTAPPEEDLLQDFFSEVEDHLSGIEEDLLSIESGVEDPEIVNNLFRSFHTIKGLSGFLNLNAMNVLAHRLENLLDRVRKGTMRAEAVAGPVFHGVDLLKGMLGALSGGEEEYDLDPVREFIRSLDESCSKGGSDSCAVLAKNEGVKSPAEPAGDLPLTCDTPGKEDITACDNTPADGERSEAVSATGCGKNEPGGEPDWKSTQAAGGVVIRKLDRGVGIFTPVSPGPVSGRGEGESRDSDTVSAPSTATVAMRKPVWEPRSTANSVKGEKPPAKIASTPPATKKRTTPAPPRMQQKRKHESIKVDVDRLDKLINLIGELVITHTQVSQNPALQAVPDQKIDNDIIREGKIIKNIQELSMALRMVTMKGVFLKMARLVRDLALKSGKKISFVTAGEDTELDRNVVDVLTDPLIHLLRNAVDHGIESTDERLRSGKKSVGNIELSATQAGGYLIIDITDDGRGLNRDKILTKAKERGLIPENAVLSDREINELILLPGFSTSGKVTAISGRGVGMDVVHKSLEKLRGSMDISSTPGEGIQVHIKLPLNLSILDGLVVRVGEEKFIFSVLDVVELFQPQPYQIRTVKNTFEVVTIHGEIYPVIRLRELLHSEISGIDASSGILVMTESEGHRMCFLVDEILGQQQVVIKNLGYGIQGKGVFTGGAILGDGTVGIILDVEKIGKKANVPELTPSLPVS